jgi:hypothetical protein
MRAITPLAFEAYALGLQGGWPAPELKCIFERWKLHYLHTSSYAPQTHRLQGKGPARLKGSRVPVEINPAVDVQAFIRKPLARFLLQSIPTIRSSKFTASKQRC